MNQLQQIAARIKELREILEISSMEVSAKVGISEQEYLLYESAKKDIPIGILYAVADILSVDPTVLLTGDVPRMDAYTVVRKDEGVLVERFKGYNFSSLAFNYIDREMEPMIVTIEQDEKKPELVMHKGQEFNYVLEGNLSIVIGKHTFELSEGDSIYFDSRLPHGQRALSSRARFLTVINE